MINFQLLCPKTIKFQNFQENNCGRQFYGKKYATIMYLLILPYTQNIKYF